MKYIKYFNYFFLLFLFSCTLSKVDSNQIEKLTWNPDKLSEDPEIVNLFKEINFIPLTGRFTPKSAPDKSRIYKDNKYLLWREFKKIGKYSKQGVLIDSIASVSDTKMDLGPMLDFDFYNDSLYILNGEKISVFSEFDFKKVEKSIPLMDFYNSFCISQSRFYFYSAETTHFLTITDFNLKNAKYEFPTNEWPFIRGDYFPHFVKTSKSIIFCHPYNPSLYLLEDDKTTHSEYLSLNLEKFAFDNEEKLKLKAKPNDRNSEISITNSNYCYFDDLLPLNKSFLFTFKLNGKFYYNLWDEKDKKLMSFRYFKNSTEIPFTVGKGLLDFIFSDGDKSLFVHIDPEYILAQRSELKKVNNPVIKSNWNEIYNKISLQSSPFLCELKLK